MDSGNVEPPVPDMQSAPMMDEQGRAISVVCPGAQGCESNEGTLRVAASARPITPVVEGWDDVNQNRKRDADEPFFDEDGDGEWDPVWMAGFDIGRAAQGVHDDVWSRVLVLEQGDVRVGVVSLDTVGLFQPDVRAIREAVADLDFDHVIVATTHNHETRDTMGIWGKDAGTTGRDPAYIQFVVDQSRAALMEATGTLTDVILRVAEVDAPDLVADSRLPIVKASVVRTLLFEDSAQNAVATWTIWGNHPEALSSRNDQITSDYPHYLRTSLEASFPGSVAVFSAGNLGGLMGPLDIVGCPDEQGMETCPSGTFDLADYIGTNVATLVTTALSSDQQSRSVASPELSFKRAPFYTSIDNLTFVLAFQIGLMERDGYLGDTFVEASRLRELPLAELTGGDFAITSEVNTMSLGDVHFMTIPGELYPELWFGDASANLAESPPGADYPDAAIDPALFSVLPPGGTHIAINNANDALGYIIPKSQFDRDEPRAYEENGQYGEQNSTGPEMAPVLFEAARSVAELELQ